MSSLAFLFTSIFNVVFYFLYSIFKLSVSSIGIGSKILFPIFLTGKGKISFGQNSKIGKRLKLAVSKNSKINFGNYCRLSENIKITLSKDVDIEFGAHIMIGPNCIFYIQSRWLIGSNVSFASNCSVFSRERNNYGELKIGDGTNIGDNSLIDLTDNVTVGKKVAIGAFSIIYTHDHDFSANTFASWEGPIKKREVIIEDGAWVGSRVIILPGVVIGKRSVVAAGSVVTKDVLPNTVVAGVPARLVKSIVINDSSPISDI